MVRNGPNEHGGRLCAPVVTVQLAIPGCKGEVVVGEHDTLGRAGGARGVHQVAAQVGS